MDGRGTLPGKRLAKTWSAGTWQAIAYATLSALLLTNAAWFYTSRVHAVEAQEAKQAAAAAQRAAVSDAAQQVYVRQLDALPQHGPSKPLAENERCIAGQRVRVEGSRYTEAGDC